MLQRHNWRIHRPNYRLYCCGIIRVVLADIGSAVTFAALMVGAFMAVGGLAIGFLTGAIVGFIQRIEVGLVLGAVIGSTLAVMFFANGLLSEQSTIIYGSSGAVVGLISALLIRRRERHQVKYTA